MCPGLSMQAQVSFKSEEERDSSVEKLDLLSLTVNMRGRRPE